MSEVKAIYLKDYKKPEFIVEQINLTFELQEECATVTNVMQIKAKSKTSTLKLDSIDLELLEIYLDDHKLDSSRYSYEDEILSVNDVPSEFTLKIKNKIYPQNNTELEGLYKSGDIFCTQNEPEGFRRITPYIDRPDVMAVFTTTVIADKEKYPVLLSNGNKAQCHDSFNSKHGVTWFDPHPKPSYLFALVAGDLGSINDSFKTKSGKDVELNIYCDRGNESKCYHAMKSLKDAMLWDEKMYGREYDLDIYNIVAVDSFNMGAMENKGLNIFNSHYVLASKELATDHDFMGIQSVIAHEYFHNWTGNRITCRDWFQLTLKEGLTVFRDQCFSSDLNSKEVQRIEDVKALRERQFVEDSSPTAHPIQPESYISMNNFYTATVYEKGAEVIRMIHTLLGEEDYRKATDLYFESFDGQAVTTKDFLWAMSEASGIDLGQFEKWYHQSGTPRLLVSEIFENNTYTLRLTQVIPNTVDGKHQSAYYYPLKIALLDEGANEVVQETIIVSKEFEEFSYSLDSKPTLSINRDFSAPIIIKQERNNYPFLSRHDSNSFVRYESMQSYAIETLEQIIQTGEIESEFVDTYGYILEDNSLDLSFKSLLLDLPSVSTLMQRQDVIDFEPLYEARERLKKHLASVHNSKLLLIYKEHNNLENDKIDAKSTGQRSIKNRALKMLSALKSEDAIELARVQYENSKTMTDKIVALDILENTTQKESAIATADFYQRYKDDTLVMNKYFSILAASSRDGTLDRVMALQNDEVYDQRVPNLVRSLIGVFARNYKHFHAKDGHGYTFVADKIMEIDKINAQMASALLGAFKIYEKMNSTNKELMRVQLERIASEKSLSKNTYEIITKILS